MSRQLPEREEEATRAEAKRVTAERARLTEKNKETCEKIKRKEVERKETADTGAVKGGGEFSSWIDKKRRTMVVDQLRRTKMCRAS